MFDRLKYFFINNKRPLLIAAAVLIVAIIALSFFPFGKKSAEKTAAPKVNGTAVILNGAREVRPAEATTEEKANAAVFVVAKSFAEIYGTYSNQSNFSNLEGATGLITSNYRTEIESFLRQARANFKPEPAYKGVTTLAINTVVESLDEASGAARVTVKTQRQESGGTATTVKYQDIKLDLLKEGGRWLVNRAEWVK